MYLDSLLSPNSIALLGASNREGSLGYDMMQMIKQGNYKGEVYPINPGYDEILGYKAYKNFEEIGKPVDMAVLSLAAHRVEEQVDLAIENGIKSLTIFANCVLEEEDKEAYKLADRIIDKCEKAGIPLLGHNAMGYYNNDIGLRICGFIAPDANVKGNISLISQSGSVFSTIGHNEPQLKFNLMVATGTGEVTSLSDYMLYALNMKTTKVLGVYMESVRKPEKFIEALKIARDKRIPVVLMKVGKSELGAEFAKSHTGGLAGDDDSIQAIYDHYGVIRANNLQEMANLLALFSYFPYIPKGGLVGIADSGGERNLLADIAEEVGIKFAELSDETMKLLNQRQEYGQDADNPLDPWGTGIDFEKIFGDSMEIMLNDDNSALGIISQDLRDGYYLSEGCIKALEQGYRKTGKPVAFLTNLGGTRRSELTKYINNSILAPVLSGTDDGLRAIKKYFEFRDFNYKSKNREKLDINKSKIEILKNKRELSEVESLDILKEFNIPVLDLIELTNLEDLRNNKKSIKYPVVLKTSEEGILHKADVGGVILNINSYDDLEHEYLDMSKRLGEKAIVVPMFKMESEFIIGMKKDPIFGPIIVVGAGGNLTELLKDKIVITPYASKQEIRDKLSTLKTFDLLNGFRGRSLVDLDKFIDIIDMFCNMVITLSEYIEEVDVNPIAINGDEIYALDALIITK